MKVTRRGLIAITCILNEIIESDNGTNEEISITINFLKTFKLSDDKLKQIVDEACKMSFDDAAAVVRNMDEANKQELSNIISEIMLADGAVSDAEAVKLMEVITECDVPMPDSQAWIDWCTSADNDEVDDLSGEDSEICFFIIRAGGPHYGGKCRTVINKEYVYGISDSTVAKMFLGCKEHVLYDCGESGFMDMLTREMGFEGQGKFHGYVCKKPYDSSDNHAASEIFGKKISGHCLIRFKSNEGQYLEMNKAQCERMYELLKENLSCKLLHRTEDQRHFHKSGPIVMRLSRQPIEVERPLTDDEKIRLWLKENDPADHGCLYRLDHQEFMRSGVKYDIEYDLDHDYDAKFVTLKDVFLYIIGHDDEHPYDLLTNLGKAFRRLKELEYAIYWGHKAALLIDKALEEKECEGDDIEEEKRLINLRWDAYSELGYSYSSFQSFCTVKLPDLNKAIEAFKNAGPADRAIETGKAYMGLGDYASAEKWLLSLTDRITITDSPWYYSIAYAYIGLMHYIRKDEKKALQYWNESIKIKDGSGLGHYFKGRHLWKIKYYDSAIQLWQEGEKMGSRECSCELLQWHAGYPSSSQHLTDTWNKMQGFAYSETKEIHKYLYKYIANGTFVIENDEYKIADINELWDGMRKRCPHCLKLLAEIGCLDELSKSELNRIMKAWLYDGIEY